MKYIIIFSFFILNLYANRFGIVEDIQISEDFNTYKQVNYLEYKNKVVKKFSIKLDINKYKLKNKTYYLTIVSDDKNLIYTNTKYYKYNHLLIIKLDKNSFEKLFFNYEYKEAKRAGFRYRVISELEYKYILPYEGILYGLAYGIIFCAFLYYFIIYFSTRQKCFLYYSIMQLFVLLSLVGFVYFSYKPYPSVLGQALVDIFETSGFLFTLLFTKEILSLEKNLPKVSKIVNFFIVLNIIDLLLIVIFKISILYEFLPFYISFLIPSLVGIISIYKGNKNAIIYTLGWVFMACFVFMAQEKLLPISGIYIIHIAAPMESLIFSFALAYTLRQLVIEKNEKEKLLIHKSKLASMGEMINNIAHQWRQPLTHLSFINMNLQLASEYNELDKKYLIEKINESNEQIEFMSNTINSFRDFYKPQKSKNSFYISEAVKKSVDIMLPLLQLYKIEVILDIKSDKRVLSYENEYSQVILNLLSNAKEALVAKNIQTPKIKITIDVKEKRSLTTICDNAGGISEKILYKIFEPYFTTKDSGSGIGLYMSKTIINSHFKGELSVQNKKEGACFIIKV